MAAAEDLVEGRDMMGGSPAGAAHPEVDEDERDRTLVGIEARQQVLLENIVICDHMLAQLHRLRQSLADKENAEDGYKLVAQSDLQNDLQPEP